MTRSRKFNLRIALVTASALVVCAGACKSAPHPADEADSHSSAPPPPPPTADLAKSLADAQTIDAARSDAGTLTDAQRLEILRELVRKLKGQTKQAKSGLMPMTPEIKSSPECADVSAEPVFQKKAFKQGADPIVKQLRDAAMAYHPALAAEVDWRAKDTDLAPTIEKKSATPVGSGFPRKPSMPRPALTSEPQRRPPRGPDRPPADVAKFRNLWQRCAKRIEAVPEYDSGVSAKRSLKMFDLIDQLIDWILGPDPKLVPAFVVSSNPPKAGFKLTAYTDVYEGRTDRTLPNIARGYYRLHVELAGQKPVDSEFSLVQSPSTHVHCELESVDAGSAAGDCVLE